MPRKPTYEEIERRLKELDKEAVNYKRTEEALQESEKRFKNAASDILMGLYKMLWLQYISR